MIQTFRDKIKHNILHPLCPLIIIYLFLISPAYGRDAADVAISLDSDTISEHETATITITVKETRSATIEPPAVDNLVFHRGGQSSQLQIINGDYSASITTVFYLQPLKPGSYTIPPFRITSGDKTISTSELKLTVLAKQQAKKTGTETTRSTTFMTLEGIPETVYEGQIIPLTIKAFFREGMRAENIRLPELVSDALILSPIDQQPTQTVERISGKRYSVLSWNTAATAIKEGSYQIDMQMDATLLLPQKRRNQRSQFDPFFNDDFFDSFLERYQKKEHTLRSKTQSITILPLPASGQPESFNGAVGDFTFAVTASPLEINVGDPVTMTMTISGTGNFDRIHAPLFPENDVWKTYSPTTLFNKGENNLSGEKVFTQAVIINSSDITEIPSLHFSYFNPEKEKYIILSSPPLPLTVKPGKEELTTTPQKTATPVPPPEKKAENPIVETTIKLHPGTFVETISPLYTRAWFLTLVVICTLVLAGVLIFSLLPIFGVNNLEKKEKERQQKILSEKLALLKEAAEGGETEEFLMISKALIRLYAGAMLDIAPEALTFSDLKEQLPEESSLSEIYALSEQQLYGGGQQLSSEKMNDYFNALQKELEKG